jgi:ADP-ribose pyrophosphatase YjhB (NUDIX family)
VPGGFCGPREHPKDAAAREVREETGLVVRVGSIAGIWMDTYAPEGPHADKVTLNVYFHAEIDGPERTTTDPNEVTEIGWFRPEELPRELAFPGHVPALLAAWKESSAEGTPPPRRGSGAFARFFPGRKPTSTV